MNNNQTSKLLLYFLGVVAIFIMGFYFGRVDLIRERQGFNYDLEGEVRSSFNGVNLNLLWEVWAALENEHYDENLDGNALLYGAVDGLVSGVGDKYTTFLSPQETEQYEQSNRREFEGIGTTLVEEDQFVAVETPLDGFPAQEAGLQAHDIILRVDDEDVQSKSVIEVAQLIRGEAGTSVKISVFRPDSGEQLVFDITRSRIDLDNIVTEYDEESGVATIKIYQFTEENVIAFNRLWDEQVAKALSYNPEALIIDLRNNPGGYVDAVNYVASEFLPKGEVIFIEEDRDGRQRKFEVERTGKLIDIPMVVLVNEGSASAAEIFSGAMQDNDRAQVVGMPTVGKGVEQKIVDLSDGSTLQVVFRIWKTPSGRAISPENPINPDIEVDDYLLQEDQAVELLIQ